MVLNEHSMMIRQCSIYHYIAMTEVNFTRMVRLEA